MASPTVLVVDDDAALRMLCRVNLELEGYRVLEAGTVAAAEAVLEREAVDIVLLDLHVGADDGLDLVGRLREKAEMPTIVLLTGSVEIGRLGKPDGVSHIIAKPFSLNELTAAVGGLARR